MLLKRAPWFLLELSPLNSSELSLPEGGVISKGVCRKLSSKVLWHRAERRQAGLR